nr:hypothetical protein [Streptomyces milbemycinicus]
MAEHLTISTLILQHRIPDDWAADPWAEVHPLIDGVDVLKEVHPEGLGLSCRHWRGPAESWPLAVTEEPRRIMITEPTCTAGCCGALYVTIRREGDQVIWAPGKTPATSQRCRRTSASTVRSTRLSSRGPLRTAAGKSQWTPLLGSSSRRLRTAAVRTVGLRSYELLATT